MALERLHILIVEPSTIIRRGIISILFDIDSIGVDISEVTDIASVKESIEQEQPDIVIINPLHLGIYTHEQLSEYGVKVIALQSFMLNSIQLECYDGVISIVDSPETIEQTLQKLLALKEAPDNTLSAREQEIVAAIALGQSNKEIADKLCISAHTVMTHRKNIASKLKIRNSAGLTIYAIVNKLISLDEIN